VVLLCFILFDDIEIYLILFDYIGSFWLCFNLFAVTIRNVAE